MHNRLLTPLHRAIPHFSASLRLLILACMHNACFRCKSPLALFLLRLNSPFRHRLYAAGLCVWRQISMHTLNQAHSAFATVSFPDLFFKDFSVSGKIDSCKILLKVLFPLCPPRALYSELNFRPHLMLSHPCSAAFPFSFRKC